MIGQGKISGLLGAILYTIGFMREILFTIVPQKNLVTTTDRIGLTRSDMFLFVFIIIHAVGHLQVFLGPDDFNGYGYFYVRLHWTGFGLQANIVEQYILLAALLHIFVALKRTWDNSINSTIASGKLKLAISGNLCHWHDEQFRWRPHCEHGERDVDERLCQSKGNGAAENRICPVHATFGEFRGNVCHDNGRFGLCPDLQMPRMLHRDENGYLVRNTDGETDWDSCEELTKDGHDNGLYPANVIEDHLDCRNTFVGQYSTIDAEYRGYVGVNNRHCMYWKSSNNFVDPTAYHTRDSICFTDVTDAIFKYYG